MGLTDYCTLCNMSGMENLATYLKSEKISQREFALSIGINHSVVSRFASGRARPSLSTALAIERATGGRVPVVAWEEEQ